MIPLSERIRRYLATLPQSIQGSQGSKDIFRVAVALVRGFGLTIEEALPYLREWNDANALPPWSERELIEKLQSAERDSSKSPGYLLADGDRPVQARQTVHRTAPLPPAPLRVFTAEEMAAKAADRAVWPKVRPPTPAENSQLAKIRDTPSAPVEILAQVGLAAIDDTRPECYVLCGQDFRQYRRFDGGPMPCGQKSQNAKGSLGKGFLTLKTQFRNLEPGDLIFILEGAIGLLEAVAIQWLCAPHARRWKFLASICDSSRFFYEPDILQAIAGHHCRILPDPGEAGSKAARAWRDELKAAGCTVDFAVMPDGFQDLKILLAAGTEGIGPMRSILQYPTSNRKEIAA